MKGDIGILRFLGTNCDQDVWQAVEVAGYRPRWLWYEDRFQPQDYEAFVVPGGFSHGDYLRCGALAAKSPAVQSLSEAAGQGRPILGICNGFQILCEAELLPGALVRNHSRRFVDRWAALKVENASSFTPAGMVDTRIQLPIAHGEGCYTVADDERKKLEDGGQIWLRYLENPNGSVDDIAGVMNNTRNVCGLMPHPERAIFDWMGDAGGLRFFEGPFSKPSSR